MPDYGNNRDLISDELNAASDELASVYRKHNIDGVFVAVRKASSGLYESASKILPSERTRGFLDDAAAEKLSELDGAELTYTSYFMHQTLVTLLGTLHELMEQAPNVTSIDAFETLVSLQKRLAAKKMREFTRVGETTDA